jgi:hypothetical protein
MAIVERAVAPGITADQVDQVRQAVLKDGPLEGELFHVNGPTAEGWCFIDGWESAEHCDRAMARYMPVFQELGISLEGMSPPERFEIHMLEVPAAATSG